LSYYLRIALFSAALALATAGLLLFGPRAAGVTLAAYAPSGQEVATGAQIRLAFSRPVDRRSAEASFRIDPPAPGRFVWDDRTLTFLPSQPLAPDVDYTVSVARGLRDERGRANITDLRWSFRTRGSRLLVLRAADDGASELWLVAPDGGAARQLLRAPDGISDVAVAPDGARALYVEPRGLERSALMLLDLDSGATRPLADDPGFSAAAPAWSPPGDFIAFERRAVTAGALGVPRVWLGQPDGSILGPLTSGDGADISYAPAWSPDGNSVAFVDGLSQELKIYSFFTDETAALPARTGERASWLPDGSALVISAAEDGAAGLRLRLRRVGVEPPFPTADLSDGAAAELSPAVAPDGLRVAYARRAPGSPDSQIWLAPLDGGPGRPLSTAGPHQDTQPLWSPDGRSVAFVRAGTGGPGSGAAVVVDVDGGVERTVLDGALLLAWAP